MTDALVSDQRARAHDRDLLVGVDVGGSKIAVLVVDGDLEIRGRLVVPTPVGSPDTAADHIATTVAAALETARAGVERVAASGVSGCHARSRTTFARQRPGFATGACSARSRTSSISVSGPGSARASSSVGSSIAGREA